MIDFEKYLRAERLPLLFCAGCGHGIALKAILGAIDRLGLEKDEIAMVSGIGCSSRVTGYVDFNTLHTTHGRAIAFATGVKLANPRLTVIVVTGDGDAVAIGGNHLIHAARRNIDVTVVLLNNWIYGMTGGQASPTTPRGLRATTAPHGSVEPAFDIAALVACAGASFVARASVAGPLKASRLIERGIAKQGFSLVEVFTPCPTAFGRQNKIGKPLDGLNWIKERTVDAKRAGSLSKEELEGKLVTGVVADVDRPEYTEVYGRLIERLRAEGAGPELPERETSTAWSNGKGAVP
jgi:2-oxoglutarate/2-oxoacid ferredoxin oxidoreductase subunit beta